MSVFRDEGELKEFLKEKIKHIPSCKDVWIGRNLAKRLYYQGRKLFTKDPSEYLYPLAQPEIDFIVRDAKEVVYLPLSGAWDELPPGLPALHGKENPLRSIAEVQRMNKFLRLLLIINAHEQKHELSSIPSAKGITFERRFAVPRNSSFPMEEFF